MKPVLIPLPKDFKSPHQILSELGIQSPSQINLEAIAQYCGATGHWMWDRGQVAYHCHDKEFDGADESDSTERRANRYAVDLLMPESMICPLLECNPLTIESLQLFAKLFQTSVVATSIRVVELAVEPAILIYEEEGKRRWYVKSPKVPKELKLKTELESSLDSWVKTWPKDFAHFPSEIHREELALSPLTKVHLIRWSEALSH